MISALLLAAAPAPTAVDAERAFARDAQRLGQWTAFAKWADDTAVLFTPQAVWAHSFLKDRKNPPRAVEWWPIRSFVSCDGRTAVNTGPAFRPDGTHYGSFTTVWQRDKGQWRWVYDNGGPPEGKPPRAPQRPQIVRATCRPKAPGAPVSPPPPLSPGKARTTPEDHGRGESADKTLGWDWKVEKNGDHRLRVFMWYGRDYAWVLDNNIPAQ
ncbi:MAG: hypothetical protein M3Q19_11755 [Pseudomonadota bacterium]|nr:hypothetical protein [Pseudomonadota bacterium]